MRCLFTHSWGRKSFDGSNFYVRTCTRCGTVQRGIYGNWETIREFAYVKSEQLQFVREPSSRGERFAHTLGLRRTRTSDRDVPVAVPDQMPPSSPGCDSEQCAPLQPSWSEDYLANRPDTPNGTERIAERRRNKRINVALPVVLDNASGVTRDVSPSGVFFWKRGTIVYGDSVTFSMGRKTETGDFTLMCKGVVTRTEPRGSDVGVAIRITRKIMGPAIERAITHGEDKSEVCLGAAA